MEFTTKLVKGTLLKRYKRFLADVELTNGDIITAHCANPGAMLGLKEPGLTVWLSPSDNPKRKLKYSWELVELAQDQTLVGINTSHPNKLVEEAILNGTIKELQGYQSLKREVKYGQNSRIDLLLSEPKGKPDQLCYVEVKNVHLLRKKGLAEFPDSVTSRGAKHLNELSVMVKQGHRAVMVYVVQRGDATRFSLADDIDPHYAQSFVQAQENGVEALAYKCQLSPQEIVINKKISIK